MMRTIDTLTVGERFKVDGYQYTAYGVSVGQYKTRVLVDPDADYLSDVYIRLPNDTAITE